ncbi:MAG TPA: hypothetical protein H9763_07565 [Candidatus Eisenbergiella merdigallinarum]|uniref:Uncharacterized protein n=1 Tax=Candidatus Eisenbergiella merdigallinarum TaxID=2838552 RepID=A0A9D2SD18_9FIRM|nr:hypothetical protein [Candidatus Eisenbergiella merdigallinarum]
MDLHIRCAMRMRGGRPCRAGILGKEPDRMVNVTIEKAIGAEAFLSGGTGGIGAARHIRERRLSEDRRIH